MKHKYVPQTKGTSHLGRPVNPDLWVTGPDPKVREKYYAFLKHRAQARYRGESYDLTWDDWNSLWSQEQFEQRGRSRDSLCISRRDPKQSWSKQNCEIVPRIQHLSRNKEFRRNG